MKVKHLEHVFKPEPNKDSNKKSIEKKEAEFFQKFVSAENGRISDICRENGLKGKNYSDYFYENIKRFLRSYVRRSKKDFESKIETIQHLDVFLLIEYFIIRFFETEKRINNEWKRLPCPCFEFQNTETIYLFDKVFKEEIIKREKSIEDYYQFSFVRDEYNVNRLTIKIRNRILGKLKARILKLERFQYLKSRVSINDVADHVFIDLLIYIREKIKDYAYYYESSADNYLIYTLSISQISKVLDSYFPQRTIPILSSDITELLLNIPEETPINWDDFREIVESFKEYESLIQGNVDEECLFLLKLRDIWNEHRAWKRSGIDLPNDPVLTYRDIQQRFNRKFKTNKSEASVKMQMLKCLGLFRDRLSK